MPIDPEHTNDGPAPSMLQEGVYQRLGETGHRFGFFQAVRLLELLFPESPPPGDLPQFAGAPIQMRPSTDLVFPATDIKRVLPRGKNQVEITVTFMGLYGVDSPLPFYFYDDLALETEETRAHRDFLDMFNHRLYAFFYRAWRKYRPGVHHRSDGEDPHSRRFVALSGLGTPHALDEVPIPPLYVAARAGLLGRQVRSAAGLKALVEAFLAGPDVTVIENVGRWVSIPSRTGVGQEGFRLGENATIGEQVYDRSGKFRLRIGPMDVDQYLALLPGSDTASRLNALVDLYVPDFLDYDAELRVRSDDLPPTRLGASGARLGLTASLGQPDAPIVSRTVEYSSSN
jgi:type VI secretion system protein ImpH